MHIAVVVSHPDFLATAGVRIRYRRLEAAFAFTGDMLTVVSVEDIAGKQEHAFDVYIFSKTYSTFAQIAMSRLRATGKLVGLDLFDDYFSQTEDARLVFFRSWMNSVGSVLDFAICSTPVLARFLAEQHVQVPTIVLPDVVAHFDLHRVDAMFRAKACAAKTSRHLSVLWFGIGDNPYFDVGLTDLAAYSGELARISRHRWDLKLTVLTNDAALTKQALHVLASIDCAFVLETWSEEKEAAALEAATVCFLPVNAQSFSRSKSLNRAVSALAAGCKVLSPGFPLYKELGESVYTTTDDLLRSFDQDYNPHANARLVEKLGRLANAYANAQSFKDFIGMVRRRSLDPAADPVPALHDIAIVHGVELDVQAHKNAKRLGAISIRSPLTEAQVNCDMAFDVDGSSVMRVLVRPNIVPLLKTAWQQRFDNAPTLGGYLTLTIPELGLPDLPRHIRATIASSERLAAATFLYSAVLNHTLAMCTDLLDGFTFHVSDRSRIARFKASSVERLAG